ncbi:hypothetical protein [Haloarcula amylovorans]|nr:hypothetical protein [Halomicroarcula amylolytica]
MTCANCKRDIAARRYHVHLSSGEAMEIMLCEGCRHKFVTAEWVTTVV